MGKISWFGSSLPSPPRNLTHPLLRKVQQISDVPRTHAASLKRLDGSPAFRCQLLRDVWMKPRELLRGGEHRSSEPTSVARAVDEVVAVLVSLQALNGLVARRSANAPQDRLPGGEALFGSISTHERDRI